MHARIARTFLFLAVFTLAVPELYATRAGSGYSSDRQSAVLAQTPIAPLRSGNAATPPTSSPTRDKQPEAPPASVVPAAPANSAMPVIPTAPRHTLPREASGPWGGMLGGALLGMGLGSLIPSDDKPMDSAMQSEGSSGSETANGASGSGISEAAIEAQHAREPVPQNKLGPALLLAVLAVIVFLAARRMRPGSR